MQRLLNRIFAIAVVLCILIVGAWALFFAVYAALYVAAIVVPILGLLYASFKARLAYSVWRSNGRFLLPDNAVRVIDPGSARMLALSEALAGAGGLALSLVLPAFMFHVTGLLIVAPLAGIGLLIGTRIARRRVAEGAQPVDVLPPE